MFLRCTLLFLLTTQLAFGLPVKDSVEFELIVFEGSDWCVKCRALEKSILSATEFETFLKTQHIELIRADFPQRIKQSSAIQKKNKQLAEQYQFPGTYPFLVLVRKKTKAYKYIPSWGSMKELEKVILLTMKEIE